jgi:anti-anti-sigma factor
MEITRTPGEGRVRLALAGRLDATWSAHVQDALAECIRMGQHEIELDLAAVPFCSSAGIRVLLVTHRQLHGIHGRLAVVACSAEVRQVLELAGLRALLATAAPAQPAVQQGTPERIERGGVCYELHPLDAAAHIAVRPIGDPGALLTDGALRGELLVERFPPSRLAVGVGAFGGDTDGCGARLGELLAVGGAAVTLAGTGDGNPDWLLCADRFVPDARLAYGLVGDGAFALEARFETHPDAEPLPLTALLEAALAFVAAPTVAFAVIADAAQLVGARLRRSPLGQRAGVFAFPAIREHLDFTAEPAYAGGTALIAGFASTAPSAALAAHLRPMAADGALRAHVHAAALPYRPIRRGRIGLAETVRALFETQRVSGLLHLLNDWRPGTGAGQTRLHRGALWCAPAREDGRQ